MKIKINEGELTSRRIGLASTFNDSELNFLREHNGLRPGKIHLFIGAAGAGKSTMRNTLLVDFLTNNPTKTAMLYLSEESEDNFRDQLAINQNLVSFLDRIYFYSEMDEDIDFACSESSRDFLNMKIIRSNCDLFIFDNITTSRFYTESFEKQADFISELKPVLSRLDCASVLFAHAGGDVKQQSKVMIDQNDIRGGKTVVNLTEFLYVMQNFTEGERMITTLRIAKNRTHPISNRFFAFTFDKQTQIYIKDTGLRYEDFKELFRS